MNIYFACSITGGRDDETEYQKIVAFLLAQGHVVPTASIAGPDVIAAEGIIGPVEVYELDTNWIKGCDILVAEVSTPSHGVGYEIGFALHLNKPVICLYQADKTVSKMILGNRDPNISFMPYADIDDILVNLQERLTEISMWKPSR